MNDKLKTLGDNLQSHTKSNVTSALIMSCISVNVYNGNPTLPNATITIHP